jgi:hypothetical protein
MTIHVSDDVTLKLGDAASPEVFTAVAQITDVTAPTKTLNVLTQHFLGSDLPTKTPTNFDYGTASFEVTWDPDNTQHTALLTARDAKTLKNFQIAAATATADILAFSAYVTEVNSGNVTQGGEMKGSITLEVTTITNWA